MKTHAVPPANIRPVIYMDAGTEEGESEIEKDTGDVKPQMVSMGYVDGLNLKTYVDQGAYHTEYYWGDRFYMPMTFLYPPSIANQLPRSNNISIE